MKRLYTRFVAKSPDPDAFEKFSEHFFSCLGEEFDFSKVKHTLEEEQ
jgi:hypothetical protein